MTHWWIWQNLGVPLWPNLLADGMVSGWLWLKLHAIHKLHKEHFEWHKDQGKEGDHA